MAGNSSITGGQTVTHTDNMSFDGTDRGGAMVADGQIWIGATASNRANDGGHVRLGLITSSDSSINVNNGPGTIDLTTSGGGGANFAPNAVLNEFDDFINGLAIAPSDQSKFSWRSVNNNQWVQIAGTADHPGIWQSNPIANSGLYLDEVKTGTHTGPFSLGGGVLTISWVVQLAALSGAGNTYRFSCGLADAPTLSAIATDAFVNGCYFQYTDTVNGGNWQIKNTSASVTTTGNTVTLVTTAFTTLTVQVNAGATSVAYFVNNVQVASSPLTTNIPTTSLTPFFLMINTAGTNPITNVDLFTVTNVLTNARPGPSPTNGLSGIVVLNYRATAISTLVTSSDMIIGVTSTAAPRTITMPAVPPFNAQEWTIKDESGGASVNNITISGNGNLIDGAATYVINNNFGAVTIYWSGANYFVV